MEKTCYSLVAAGLLLVSSSVQAAICDNEYGVCLDGKRSTFYPDPNRLLTENCENYPNLFFYCYNNGGVREFSWSITPAKAYDYNSNLFRSNGYMHVKNRFEIFNGPVELGMFQDVSDTYTFNFNYKVSYDGYDPLYMRGSHYAYRATIVLLCDGREIASTEPYVGSQPGSFGGINVKRARFSAAFPGIASNQCHNNISVELNFEGQKFRLNQLSVAILKEQ